MAEELGNLKALLCRQDQELVELRRLAGELAETRAELCGRDEEVASLKEQLRDAQRAGAVVAQSAGTSLGSMECQLKLRTDELALLRVHFLDVEQELEITRVRLREAEQRLETPAIVAPAFSGDAAAAVCPRCHKQLEEERHFQATEPDLFAREQALDEHVQQRFDQLSSISGDMPGVHNVERFPGLKTLDDDLGLSYSLD